MGGEDATSSDFQGVWFLEGLSWASTEHINHWAFVKILAYQIFNNTENTYRLLLLQF